MRVEQNLEMLLFRKHCPGYKKTSYNNTRWNLKRTEKACLYAGQMNNSNYQWEQKKKKKKENQAGRVQEDVQMAKCS